MAKTMEDFMFCSATCAKPKACKFENRRCCMNCPENIECVELHKTLGGTQPCTCDEIENEDVCPFAC